MKRGTFQSLPSLPRTLSLPTACPGKVIINFGPEFRWRFGKKYVHVDGGEKGIKFYRVSKFFVFLLFYFLRSFIWR